MLQQDWNGIETDIVVQVYEVCESGECNNSFLNPIVSSRAKTQLVITKFKMEECQLCGYTTSEAKIQRRHKAKYKTGNGSYNRY